MKCLADIAQEPSDQRIKEFAEKTNIRVVVYKDKQESVTESGQLCVLLSRTEIEKKSVDPSTNVAVIRKVKELEVSYDPSKNYSWLVCKDQLTIDRLKEGLALKVKEYETELGRQKAILYKKVSDANEAGRLNKAERESLNDIICDIFQWADRTIV